MLSMYFTEWCFDFICCGSYVFQIIATSDDTSQNNHRNVIQTLLSKLINNPVLIDPDKSTYDFQWMWQIVPKYAVDSVFDSLQ